MNIRFRCRLYCACLLVMALAGCEVKKPKGVLSESAMENLLYDYHIARAMSDNLSYNENYKKVLYTEAVFKKHGTTEAVFDSSMVWYTRNTEVLSKVYEKVNKRLKAKETVINHLVAIRDKKPVISASGDTVDVWAWQQIIALTGMSTCNKYTFVLPSDSNFKKKDELVWQVYCDFPEGKSDTTQAVVMSMQIIYENDTVLGSMRKVLHSGLESIRLQSDTLGAIKEVRGFIYYPLRDKLPHTLLVDRISLMRYHATDTLIALSDSIKADSIKNDSLKKVAPAVNTVKTDAAQPLRVTPEEMNRRRTNQQRTVRPEQIEVEKRIRQEQQDLRRERQMNQHRRQQRSN